MVASSYRPFAKSDLSKPLKLSSIIVICTFIFITITSNHRQSTTTTNNTPSQAPTTSSSTTNNNDEINTRDPNQTQKWWKLNAPTISPPTLVVYVHAGKLDDPQYEENLLFFLREAVVENDGCDYILIIQMGKGLKDPRARLPSPLPKNLKVVEHENACYDIGTVGWALNTVVTNIQKYKYIMWLNSSVRGPFVPIYARGAMHWSLPFTSKINDQVKLVGCTISCMVTPHIQSYVVATDQIGLKVLKDQGIFSCYTDINDVIYRSEVHSSTVILHAGYNIDSLMIRYQGVDWRKYDELKYTCNNGDNPYDPADFNDGLDINPLEVMFVKVKREMLLDGFESAIAGRTMDQWLVDIDSGDGDWRKYKTFRRRNEWHLTERNATDIALKSVVNPHALDHYQELLAPLPVVDGDSSGGDKTKSSKKKEQDVNT